MLEPPWLRKVRVPTQAWVPWVGCPWDVRGAAEGTEHNPETQQPFFPRGGKSQDVAANWGTNSHCGDPRGCGTVPAVAGTGMRGTPRSWGWGGAGDFAQIFL